VSAPALECGPIACDCLPSWANELSVVKPDSYRECDLGYFVLGLLHVPVDEVF
jgi:hypothetical protein